MTFATSLGEVRFSRKSFQGERPIFLRNGGSDANGGTSVGDAVATLERAFELIDYADGGETRQYFEMTGYTYTIPDQGGSTGLFQALPVSSRRATNNTGRAGAFDAGKQDYLSYPIEFYADPTLVLSITVTGYTVDTDTGLKTIDVSDTLVPSAHIGQLVNTGVAEWGVVHSNDASSLTVSSSFLSSTGAAGIYTQGCTIDLSQTFGLNLSNNGPVAFNGIKFTGNNIRNYVDTYTFFQMCFFEGFYLDGRGGICNAYLCYFNGGSISAEGAALELRDSVMQGVNFQTHGSGGNGRNTLTFSILDGCDAYGSGNFESSFDIEVENTLIINGTGHGIEKSSPQRCRISDTKINNCAGSAIYAGVGGGVCRVDTVVGTGNNAGLTLIDGAHAQIIGVNTVTGTAYDTKAGCTEYTWAQVDAAIALGETLDDAHIGERHSPHWAFETDTTDGWMGGFYDFDTGNNNFSTPLAFGVANVAYDAHIGFIQGAVSSDEITIRLTGVSFSDDGTRTPADTEDIVIAAGAADRYFESTKKWLGQVTITHFAGTAVVWNFGWVKYWDHENQDFRLQGLEALWTSGFADSNSDIEVIHHKATGWTYQASGGPLHGHIALRSDDFGVDNEHIVGPGAWKRRITTTDIIGSASEGILVHVISGSIGIGNTSFRALDVTLDIRTGRIGHTRQFCRIG